MKVTAENWKEACKDMKKTGVLDATYGENGGLQTVTTNKGNRYEFSQEVIKRLIESGAMELRLGKKIAKR